MSISNIDSPRSMNEVGEFANGVCASGTMITVMQPVITMKTWFMEGKGMPPPRYWYRGFGPNCMGVVPTLSANYAANRMLKNMLADEEGNLTFQNKIIASIGCGIAGTPIATMAERPMVTQQLSGGTFRENVSQIYAREGMRGFQKGLIPALFREIKFTLPYFVGRDWVEEQLHQGVPDASRRKEYASIIAGSFSGSISALPDMIKTTMQAKEGPKTVGDAWKKIMGQENALKRISASTAVRSVYVAGAIYVLTKAESLFKESMPEVCYEQSRREK